jgi:hypothetical protein
MKNLFTQARFALRSKAMMLALSLGTIGTSAYAQEEKDEDEKVSFSLGVTTDKFFGFAPMATGSIKIKNKLDFTFYGLYWSGGSGASWGNWAEFGAGVNVEAVDGLSINPQIAVVSGSLLSKGAAGGQFGGVFADGLVPNLTVNLDKGKAEGQVYFGYYMPIRKIKNPETNENFGRTAYIHYWANAGYRVNSYFSFGAHWEHLWGGTEKDGSNVYQWLGPYVQFSAPSGKAFFRFAGGPDFVDGGDSFYKMTLGFNF